MNSFSDPWNKFLLWLTEAMADAVTYSPWIHLLILHQQITWFSWDSCVLGYKRLVFQPVFVSGWVTHFWLGKHRYSYLREDSFSFTKHSVSKPFSSSPFSRNWESCVQPRVVAVLQGQTDKQVNTRTENSKWTSFSGVSDAITKWQVWAKWISLLVWWCHLELLVFLPDKKTSPVF